MFRSLKWLAVALLVVGNHSFAATPVAEPLLPTDIDTYQKKEKSCTKYAGKVLTKTTYLQETANSRKKITVITLNGTKVAQMESVRASGSSSHFTYYVKNSAGRNWLAYPQSEVWDAVELLLSEIGLSQRQFLSCGGK